MGKTVNRAPGNKRALVRWIGGRDDGKLDIIDICWLKNFDEKKWNETPASERETEVAEWRVGKQKSKGGWSAYDCAVLHLNRDPIILEELKKESSKEKMDNNTPSSESRKPPCDLHCSDDDNGSSSKNRNCDPKISEELRTAEKSKKKNVDSKPLAEGRKSPFDLHSSDDDNGSSSKKRSRDPKISEELRTAEKSKKKNVDSKPLAEGRKSPFDLHSSDDDGPAFKKRKDSSLQISSSGDESRESLESSPSTAGNSSFPKEFEREKNEDLKCKKTAEETSMNKLKKQNQKLKLLLAQEVLVAGDLRNSKNKLKDKLKDKVPLFEGSTYRVDRILHEHSRSQGAAAFINAMLGELFTTSTLVVSNIRGGKSKHSDASGQRWALDKHKRMALSTAVTQFFKDKTPSQVNTAILQRISTIRHQLKLKGKLEQKEKQGRTENAGRKFSLLSSSDEE